VIALEFLETQLNAQPFIPFVLVLNSGDRYTFPALRFFLSETQGAPHDQ
jgi:hypothetical protein